MESEAPAEAPLVCEHCHGTGYHNVPCPECGK